MTDRPVTHDDLLVIYDRLRYILIALLIASLTLVSIGSLAYRQAIRNHEIPVETRHILCVSLAQLAQVNEKLLAEQSPLPSECTREVLRGKD